MGTEKRVEKETNTWMAWLQNIIGTNEANNREMLTSISDKKRQQINSHL